MNIKCQTAGKWRKKGELWPLWLSIPKNRISLKKHEFITPLKCWTKEVWIWQLLSQAAICYMLGEICDPAHVNIIAIVPWKLRINDCDSHIQVEYIFPYEILWCLWFITMGKSLKDYLGICGSQKLTQSKLKSKMALNSLLTHCLKVLG